MVELKFRPLRRHKKTGKIIVAGYMQWRKLWCTRFDKPKVEVIIDEEFKPTDYVFNHKGEQLFWKPKDNPDLLTKRYSISYNRILAHVGIWETSVEVEDGFEGHQFGVDCDGIPAFSHYDSKYIATHTDYLEDWEPLTVDMVNIWFGYVLWRHSNYPIEAI